jgi:hypothetical protein
MSDGNTRRRRPHVPPQAASSPQDDFINDGLAFDPSGKADSNPEVYNLWHGFAVQPQKGSWDKLKVHILNITSPSRSPACIWSPSRSGRPCRTSPHAVRREP